MTRETETEIIVLQHVECDALGTIEWALQSKGLRIRYVRPFADEPIPDEVNDAKGLIVMGGPMGVMSKDGTLTFATNFGSSSARLLLANLCWGSASAANCWPIRSVGRSANEIGRRLAGIPCGSPTKQSKIRSGSMYRGSLLRSTGMGTSSLFR